MVQIIVKKHTMERQAMHKKLKSLIVHEKKTNSLIEENQFLMFKKRKLIKTINQIFDLKFY